jgi:hypothetical protein
LWRNIGGISKKPVDLQGFVTHQEGWRFFCSKWLIEPTALLKSKPGWDIVSRTDSSLPEKNNQYRALRSPARLSVSRCWRQAMGVL